MVLMGALQPDIPSPVAIPLGYFKIIIDLNDCLFTFPLHPKDQKCSAFSLPSINFQAPTQRYQWCVLPQGMATITFKKLPFLLLQIFGKLQPSCGSICLPLQRVLLPLIFKVYLTFLS